MNNKLDDTFVIMGIDPGTNIMGFGIIKVEKKEMRLIDMIEYKLPKSDDHNIKLSKIFKKTTELIKIHRPNYISIESPFLEKMFNNVEIRKSSRSINCCCVKF